VSGELLEALGVGEETGVLVSEVEAGSAAARGGLVRGDVILRVQGSAVEGVESFDSLLVALGEDEVLSIVVASAEGTRELSLAPDRAGE
jgi:S1-C subfamily serine protease